jgi:hypothetical protein
VAAEVLRRVRSAAGEASAEPLRNVLAAASGSNWLTGAIPSFVRLRAAAALKRATEQEASPLDLDELRDVAVDARVDGTADETLGIWLTDFAEAAEDVWQVIEPLLGGTLPIRSREALSRYIERLDSDAHLALVDWALNRALDGSVSHSFFRAARLSELNHQRLADRLIELCQSATNHEARERVIDLWALVQPSSQSVRRRLVENIYIPLTKTGDRGLDLALTNFGLVADVQGIRNGVRKALRGAAKKDRHKKRVEKRFEEAGWSHRDWKKFGRRGDV